MAHPLAGVKTRRTLLGIPATHIAKRLAMAATSYSRLERGERRCYMDKGAVLAVMLKCSMEQLGIEPTGDTAVALFARGQQLAALGGDHAALDALDAWPNDDQPEQLNDLTVPLARGTVVTHTPVETQIAEAQSAYIPPNLDDPAVMAALVADWSDMDDDDTVD